MDTCNWAGPVVGHNSGSSSDTSEEVADEITEIREAVEYIDMILRDALKPQGACLSSLDDELEETVQFAGSSWMAR